LNHDFFLLQQQGMSGTQVLGTAIESNKMNMPEDEDIPVCSGYQIGPTIESTKMNTSEDAGTPDCSDQIDPSGIEVNEVKFTKRPQNQELLDNREVSVPGNFILFSYFICTLFES
jgi:hypothetical protein